MIKPIMNTSLTNPNFTSFYDRTCPHKTADILFSKSNTEKFLDILLPKNSAVVESKESLVNQVVNNVTNNLGADSHVALLDATDMVNTDTGVMSHLLPDGSPIELGATDVAVDAAASVVGKAVEKIADIIDFFA